GVRAPIVVIVAPVAVVSTDGGRAVRARAVPVPTASRCRATFGTGGVPRPPATGRRATFGARRVPRPTAARSRPASCAGGAPPPPGGGAAVAAGRGPRPAASRHRAVVARVHERCGRLRGERDRQQSRRCG